MLLSGPLAHVPSQNLAIVRFVVAATIILLITIPTAFLIIYLELKVIARMNLRSAPTGSGPFGCGAVGRPRPEGPQKEDFTPSGVDSPIFTMAPVGRFLATIMSLLVIPFAPGLVGQDFNIALLYFFAIGGLNVVGLMMAGWASFNKYSLIGALRAAAQVGQLRDPAHPVGGRGSSSGRHDEPEPHRRATRPARSSTGTSGSSPSA